MQSGRFQMTSNSFLLPSLLSFSAPVQLFPVRSSLLSITGVKDFIVVGLSTITSEFPSNLEAN